MTNHDHSIAIIGAGAVGRAMAEAAMAARRTISVIVTRRPAACDWIDSKQTVVTSDISAVSQANTVLICVPDDHVTATASTLQVAPGTIVAHTAGSLGLEAITTSDAHAGSIHPVMVLMPGGRRAEALKGAVAAVDGNEVAAPWLRSFAIDIGMTPVQIETTKRTQHHLAAALAGGLLTGVLADAVKLWTDAGVPKAVASAALGLMVQEIGRTMSRSEGPGPVMGPAARGDAGTIAKHLDVLQAQYPHMEDMYQSLVERCLDWSQANNTLEAASADAVRLAFERRANPSAS
ncbi:MAG: DUF2520 domain-containing protein [Phycisphaerales bacterium]|nr:DUF2520 domain-containing protein [Phycisphaerales bacterium]